MLASLLVCFSNELSARRWKERQVELIIKYLLLTIEHVLFSNQDVTRFGCSSLNVFCGKLFAWLGSMHEVHEPKLPRTVPRTPRASQ